jgi:hypothetical protein
MIKYKRNDFKHLDTPLPVACFLHDQWNSLGTIFKFPSEILTGSDWKSVHISVIAVEKQRKISQFWTLVTVSTDNFSVDLHLNIMVRMLCLKYAHYKFENFWEVW